MQLNERVIRDFLAAALRGEPSAWPAAWDGASAFEAVVDAAVFHGVAVLLLGRQEAGRWPEAVIERLRDQARAQAMWELRHRQLLAGLLAKFAANGVGAIVLKGSAIAYELYDEPAARSRGDSDLLVRRHDLGQARTVLEALGFRRSASHDELDDQLGQQEAWSLASDDGSSHGIDLHWEVLNTPALRHVLPADECFARSRAIPRLSPQARTMDQPRFLLHSCVHRALHRTAPYFVNGKAHYDEGRLIWSYDISLMSRVMAEDEWTEFATMAVDRGVADSCLAGLQSAKDDFGAAIPAPVMDELAGAGGGAYLDGSALQRAWADLRAVSGAHAKLRYLCGRMLPSAAFMRAKYPTMSGAPLIALYARRLAESLRRPVQ